MDPLSRHHRRRPSSDRFLTTFSPPTTTPSSISTTDDFDEDDVFFTTSPFSPTTTTKTTTVSSPKPPPTLRTQRSFKLEPSGILAALPEPPLSPSLSIFNHKPRQPSADSTTTVTTTTATIAPRNIPILPRTMSTTTAKYVASSAPIHVPIMPISKGRRPLQRRLQGSAFGFEDIDDGGGDDNDDDEMMLPPHEMVARRLAETPVVSCSVLEGAGRTLKGRDLRQLITVIAVALAFSSIELIVCSSVKGFVSCTDCDDHYDYSGMSVLIKCDQVKKLSTGTTDEEGTFETKLPSNVPVSQASASPSPKCLAKLLGGPSQVYALKRNMISELVSAQGDGNTYTLHRPLVFAKSCIGNCRSTNDANFGSSKTFDLPISPEYGLPPTSYYTPFIPIIGIP